MAPRLRPLVASPAGPKLREPEARTRLDGDPRSSCLVEPRTTAHGFRARANLDLVGHRLEFTADLRLCDHPPHEHEYSTAQPGRDPIGQAESAPFSHGKLARPPSWRSHSAHAATYSAAARIRFGDSPSITHHHRSPAEKNTERVCGDQSDWSGGSVEAAVAVCRCGPEDHSHGPERHPAMAVTLGAMAVIFGTAPTNGHGEPVLHGAAGPIALVAANAFVFFFGMSWGPVVWVMLGEKFPNRIRAAALSVAASAQWLANWVVTTSFPSLKGAGLGLAYGIYAGFAVLSFMFVRWVVTETNGRELEAMPDQVEVRAGAKAVRRRPRFDEA